MKSRTTEENPRHKDWAWKICSSPGQHLVAGEKTATENKPVSQHLQRWGNPGAFQALGISRAMPTGNSYCSDTLVGLPCSFGGMFSRNFLRPFSPRSALKHKTCRNHKAPRAALLQCSAVITYLLPTAAFTHGGQVEQLIWAPPQQPEGQAAPKAFTDPKKRLCSYAMDPQLHPLLTRVLGTKHTHPLQAQKWSSGLFFPWLFIISEQLLIALAKPQTLLLALRYHWQHG